jgi:hypothetical protein
MATRHGARALRRHHLARIKRKWILRVKARSPACDPAGLARRVGLHAGTGCVCSCWMCGNPRRYFGERAVQERRALSGQGEDAAR